MRNRVFGQTPSEDSPKPKVNDDGSRRHMSYQSSAEVPNLQGDDEITPVHFKPVNPSQKTAVDLSQEEGVDNSEGLESQDSATDITQTDNMGEDLEKHQNQGETPSSSNAPEEEMVSKELSQQVTEEIESQEPNISLAPTSKGKGERSNRGLYRIGFVTEIAGSGSQICVDPKVLAELDKHDDPSIKMAGQVGAQIKIRVGSIWLLASIRTQKLDLSDSNSITAFVDFLGEGDEERLTGKIYNFRRGFEDAFAMEPDLPFKALL